VDEIPGVTVPSPRPDASNERRRSPWLLIAGAAALVALLAGCRVNTQVNLYQTSSGRGVVTVSVTLDASAISAIGGRQALAAQLQDADLKAAGWTVTGPTPGPGSTTVVTASHDYTTPAQASALLADVAGGGPASERPFRVSIEKKHGFWRDERVLQGDVDLTCGVTCFGDPGLTRAFGFPTGVNPAPLAAAAGERPDQVFTFSLDARLPGRLVDSNGTPLPDGALRWTPRLGQRLQLAALTRTWNTGRIVAAGVASGVAVLLAIGLAGFWWMRRRRRRRERSRRSSASPSEAAASRS
jgi:hypothetical protein